ncbi:hypothetical protein ACKWRH_21420 [Bradyrhizobium sp. Pa8]|uniref:hypothetical protein n=1 Tax=Bradyrhizobium sp. Pa8 TaxID=3386552 RepID=UPI00403F93E2
MILEPGHAPIKFHPLANLFPMLSDQELEDLGEDMRANGQLEDVILHRDMILDGRNRYTAATRKGLPVRTSLFQGDDREALNWVISKNLKRRHLTESQRAMVAARIATLKLGANQHTQGAPIGAPLLDLVGASEPQQVEPAASISQTEAADMMSVGRRSVQRAATVVEQGIPDLQHAVEQDKVAVSVAEKIARMPEAEQPAALEKALPNGARAIMSSRKEPDESLDYFPTPPWATRALIEEILIPYFESGDLDDDDQGAKFHQLRIWEPACGEGHMAEVLREYCPDVLATDIFDYGYGDRTLDFLSDLEVEGEERDFILTNPPFGDKTEGFVLQALKRAKVGLAMFVRLQWLETGGRYERIFKDNPPTRIVFYAERVNLCKGRWEPDGSTATAYIWLIWIKGEAPRAPRWIPPTCRKSWTLSDDAERFTQHPVVKKDHAAGESEEQAA